MEFNKYYLVDVTRRQAAQDMDRYVAALKELVLDQLLSCLPEVESSSICHGRESPLRALHLTVKRSGYAEELVPVTCQKVRQALEAVTIQGRRGNQDMIGCLLRGTFTWAAWNGFSSIQDVRARIEPHPNCQIEDEDGLLIPWEHFLYIASRKGTEEGAPDVG